MVCFNTNNGCYLSNTLIFNFVEIMAGREGFEPPEVLPSTVFKTAAFNRSAISRYTLNFNSQNVYWRRHPDSNWGIKALQAHALPLGYVATLFQVWVVPETGLEPVQTQCPRDFKSLVSTNFTTRASLANQTKIKPLKNIKKL